MTKLLIITNTPNPYRLPLFHEISKLSEVEDVELLVVFGINKVKRRKFVLDSKSFTFPHKILSSTQLFEKKFDNPILGYNGLLRTIYKFKPTHVVVSGFSLATVKVFLLSFVLSFKYLIWSGTTNPSRTVNHKFRSIFAKRASGGIVYGSLAQEYLMSIGIPKKQITIALNNVGTNQFLAIERNNQAVLNLLYVGYLTKRKDVGALLPIAKELKQRGVQFVLHIVGDGEQRNLLVEKTNQLGLQQEVLFHGFIQPNDLPPYYAKSDIFLFQTTFDIWGLVLNEAMAAGCVCLASKYAGAAFDLIQEGKNGFVVDYMNVTAVVNILESLADSPELRDEIGQSARNYIANTVTIETTAKQFLSAIKPM